MKRILVSAVLILLAALRASAAFRITPEQGISQPVPASAEGMNAPSAVVSDGERFLVFWGGFATTVMPDGTVGSTMATELPAGLRELSILWTGSSYLATWQQGQDIGALTLDRDGHALAAPRVIVTNAMTRSGSLATNGRRAFMVYTRPPSLAVEGAILDFDGNVITGAIPLPIAPSSNGDAVPLVSSDGSGFAVVWRTGVSVPLPPSAMSPPPPPTELFHDFHLLRVNDRGEMAGDRIDLGRTEATGSDAVAFGGGVYAIVAIQAHVIKPADVQPQVVRFIIDAKSGAVTTLPLLNTPGTDASVLWNGSRFVAYWMATVGKLSELMTMRFSGAPESDAPPSENPMWSAYQSYAPILASNGRNIFGAWTAYTSGQCCVRSEVLGELFDAGAENAISTSPMLVSTAWSRQFAPSIATSGSDSLVVWIDERENSDYGTLVGMRIAANGAPIDSAPLEIAKAVQAYSRAAVTFTGATYLVAWHESTTTGPPMVDGPPVVIARTVGRDGSLGPRISLGLGYSPSAASNGSMALIAFPNGTGVRFGTHGELLDAVPFTITSTASAYGPRVASNGTDFFVAWSAGSDFWQWPAPDLVDVLGARVTAAGAVDAAPLPIATGPPDQVLYALGSDGRDYLAVYQLTKQGQRQALAAKRILREGQLAGTVATDDGAVISEVAYPLTVSIASDSTGFWIGWSQMTWPGESVSLVHTDAFGNPAAPVTLASDAASFPTAAIALAEAPGHPLQIVYARRVSDGPFAGTSRVFLRMAGDFATTRSRAARH